MTTIATPQLDEAREAEQTVARRVARPYVHPYLGGIILGLVLFATFFLTGNGLGASGGMNRLIVWLEDIFAPGHVDRTAYLTSMAGGSTNPFDSWVVFVFFGLFIGGALSGRIFGRSKFETMAGPRTPTRVRWLFAFLGGAIMGYGARLARGCTSGQALSGGAVLSVGSWAFMFAVFAGGYAVAYFVRKLWN
jgi:uncharacterized membrane protein YedE/YeeE